MAIRTNLLCMTIAYLRCLLQVMRRCEIGTFQRVIIRTGLQANVRRLYASLNYMYIANDLKVKTK